MCCCEADGIVEDRIEVGPRGRSRSDVGSGSGSGSGSGNGPRGVKGMRIKHCIVSVQTISATSKLIQAQVHGKWKCTSAAVQ